MSAAMEARIQALEEQVAQLTQRVDELEGEEEQEPAPEGGPMHPGLMDQVSKRGRRANG